MLKLIAVCCLFVLPQVAQAQSLSEIWHECERHFRPLEWRAPPTWEPGWEHCDSLRDKWNKSPEKLAEQKALTNQRGLHEKEQNLLKEKGKELTK